MPLRTGDTLGHYRLLREIARSNDVVWEAWDDSLGRRVAVKELQMPGSGPEAQERIRRFVAEARAAGQAQHPNIVTVFEAGERQGVHYLVMEYLEGENLRRRLQHVVRLSPADAVKVIRDVLQALKHTHARGIVHRDIKPENIHLLPDGRVKLTDFGIARILRDPHITVAGQVFGTPSYMSPEQVRGEEVDARSDLFSAGVVLFEMVAGLRPFPGDTLATVTHNILNAQPAWPSDFAPQLRTVVDQALQKDPSRRFASAEAFLQALDRLDARPQPIQAAAPQPVYSPQAVAPSVNPVAQPTVMAPPPTPAAPQPVVQSAPVVYVPADAYRSPARLLLTMVQALLLVGLLVTLVGGIVWGIQRVYQQQAADTAQTAITRLLNGGIESMNYGQLDAAETAARQVLNDGRATPEAKRSAEQLLANTLVMQGNQAMANNDYQRAWQRYADALQVQPQHAGARQGLETAKQVLGAAAPPDPVLRPQRSASGEWIPPAAPQDLNAAEQAYRQAEAALQRGDKAQAMEWLRKCVDAAPDSEWGRAASQAIVQIAASP